MMNHRLMPFNAYGCFSLYNEISKQRYFLIPDIDAKSVAPRHAEERAIMHTELPDAGLPFSPLGM